jgi:hypothetical protein
MVNAFPTPQQVQDQMQHSVTFIPPLSFGASEAVRNADPLLQQGGRAS